MTSNKLEWLLHLVGWFSWNSVVVYKGLPRWHSKQTTTVSF